MLKFYLQVASLLTLCVGILVGGFKTTQTLGAMIQDEITPGWSRIEWQVALENGREWQRQQALKKQARADQWPEPLCNPDNLPDCQYEES